LYFGILGLGNFNVEGEYRNTVKGAYIAAENERISTYNAISTNKVKLAEFIWKDDYKFEAPGVYTDGYA